MSLTRADRTHEKIECSIFRKPDTCLLRFSAGAAFGKTRESHAVIPTIDLTTLNCLQLVPPDFLERRLKQRRIISRIKFPRPAHRSLTCPY